MQTKNHPLSKALLFCFLLLPVQAFAGRVVDMPVLDAQVSTDDQTYIINSPGSSPTEGRASVGAILAPHTARTDNPHGVTLEQIGGAAGEHGHDTTWHGIRVIDPAPLPIGGAWIRLATNTLAYSPDGVTVQTVGLAASPISLPTFPGAVGYGASTSGGVNRAGATTIYKVTNLNDSGAGSLRAAVEASGNRVVVFETSGAINLASRLIITNPNITIAGETAPAPGVLLTGYGVYANTNDVVIRHLAIRTNDPDPVNADAVQVYGNNVMIDHVSMSWANDEIFSVYGQNITLSNSIIAEGVNSYGAVLVGDNSKNVAIVGNVVLSTEARNPLIKGDTTSAIVNNIFYNGDSEYTVPTDPEDAGPMSFSVIGNLYKDGPNSINTYAAIAFNASVKTGSKLYATGNSYTKTVVHSSANPFLVAESPVLLSNIPVATVDGSFAVNTIAAAGARPLSRDSVDTRLISEFNAGGGGWKTTTPAYPTYAVNSRNLTAGAAVGATGVTWPATPDAVQPSGYTALEEALHALAAAIQ